MCSISCSDYLKGGMNLTIHDSNYIHDLENKYLDSQSDSRFNNYVQAFADDHYDQTNGQFTNVDFSVY